MREASDDLPDRANRRGAAGPVAAASARRRRGRKARTDDTRHRRRPRRRRVLAAQPRRLVLVPRPARCSPSAGTRRHRSRRASWSSSRRCNKRLEDLKRVAVMNPTDANLTAYMRYQRMVMNKSEHFAERWQRLVWTVPDLDYGLSGRPTNAMAINVFDEQQRERRRRPSRPWPPPTGSSSCSAAIARIATASRRS